MLHSHLIGLKLYDHDYRIEVNGNKSEASSRSGRAGLELDFGYLNHFSELDLMREVVALLNWFSGLLERVLSHGKQTECLRSKDFSAIVKNSQHNPGKKNLRLALSFVST